VVRDAVLAEGVPGGFSGLYPVLGALEEAGRVRRGYFVEGLGGAQFALPGAVDRLRAGEAAGAATVLAAADPANLYGASIPWPDNDGRPSRSAGAYVVIVDGRATAFIERGGKTVLTFTAGLEALGRTAAAIHGLASRRMRRMVVSAVDGAPAGDTPLGRMLLEAGFARSYKGLAARP
jgi:ATP-dependent Lhr-like helicase